MAQYGFILFCYFSSVLILSIFCGATDENRKVHIVYMGSLPDREDYLPSSHHLSMLQEVLDARSLENSLIRSYKRSFNGFAAKLTDDEKQKLASMKEVVSVFPSRTYQLQTTRSWDFMGFNETVIRNVTTESDTIIGIIDTGISPESASFNDVGFGPAPKKWKGACNGGTNFTCNNKIIGARYYASESARDDEGHGTHTASTAAGNKVKDTSFYGLAQGTARGGVPSARIAAYKVCTPHCSSTTILAAFDDAIADGVDIISISIGFESAINYLGDAIAIGSFHAMEKGILTLHSAGNEGPIAGSMASVAPWILTVAASSTDRLFIDKVVLGNGNILVGNSVNTFTLNETKFPLIYGKDASTHCSDIDSGMCEDGCLDSNLVKGKIVLCDQATGNFEAQNARAVGSIMKTKFDNVSFIVSLPASALNAGDYDAVKAYMNTTKKPEATVLKSEVIKDLTAPVVAPFSSRGPNPVATDIMKPDLTAPGVDILAAYSPLASPSNKREDTRSVKYSIMSGTSMACPHVAGVAAYVKTFHPDWSPSAIKSALMTTAWPMDASKNLDAEFAYGSGHIDPVKAVDPGLVYEASKVDYIKMLCGLGYNGSMIRQISGDNSTCPEGANESWIRNLNYPSMISKVSANTSEFKFSFHRTLTNVGPANSTYKAVVSVNPKIEVTVEPEILSFKSLNEKKSFNVTVVGGSLPNRAMLSTSLVWSDGIHSVRSPIVVYKRD